MSAIQQEIFDLVATHLFTQGKRSFQNGCLYRGPDGTKCAVGCLIPDVEYSCVLETQPCDCDVVLGAIFPPYRKETRLLALLQGAHDYEHNWHSAEALRGRLKYVAQSFGLDTTTLDALQFPQPVLAA